MPVIAIVFDLIILAILVLGFALGWKKGLLLSLCGLVVVIVSFIGAGVLANTLQEPVAKVIEPKLVHVVQNQVDAHSEELDPDAIFNALKNGSSFNRGDLSGYLSDDLSTGLDALKEQGGALYDWITDLLKDTDLSAVTSLPSVNEAIEQLTAKAAHALALKIAHAVVLVVAFFVLLIVLTVLLHALNLVAKLPVLRTFNGLGGAVIGLIKAVIILFVVGLALRVIPFEVLPEGTVGQTHLLRFFLYANPFALLSWF